MPFARSSKLKVVEQHGEALEAELDDFLADHAARVAERSSTVRSRLASLEAEAKVLERTSARHGAASS